MHHRGLPPDVLCFVDWMSKHKNSIFRKVTWFEFISRWISLLYRLLVAWKLSQTANTLKQQICIKSVWVPQNIQHLKYTILNIPFNQRYISHEDNYMSCIKNKERSSMSNVSKTTNYKCDKKYLSLTAKYFRKLPRSSK